MKPQEIKEKLFSLADGEYRLFQAKLMPGVSPDRIIGVRTPELRKLSKELAKEADIGEYLDILPHEFYDEYNLHGFIISEEKDYDRCIERLDAFLPYVDNWATCDLLSPKIFRKKKERLRADIERWLSSEKTYTIRFGIEMLMSFFLDKDFDVSVLSRVAEIRSGEYYVNMMIAWFFATALTKQWECAVPYIEERRLDVWTHNKAIQKAIESYRVTDEQKDYLRTLRISTKK